MTSLRATLRLLLLFAALLNYAAAASAHDHDKAPPAGEGLCAICVYVGGTLGGAPAPKAAPFAPQWHAPPEASAYRVFVAPFLSSLSIRGPPSPV